MHTYVEIASDVQITTEWSELKPEKAMKFDRRRQEVFLRIPGCRMHSEKPGLILPSGIIVNPEVQMVDEFGEEHTLRSGHYGASPINGNPDFMEVSRAGYSGKLPKDRTYKSILVRSDKEFICSKIIWHNYNMK